MLVRLIRDAKVQIKAGETVDVSPETYTFLISVGSAVPATEAAADTAAKAGTKKPAAKKK